MSSPIEITISTNAIDAKHWADMLSRTQLPYAMSVAVNSLAFDVRDDEQGKLDKYFEIRTPWLKKKGAMPVVRSNKKQMPDIHAILGVKDKVAALAILGGTKKAKSGAMAVPMSNAGDGASTREILNPGTQTLGPKTWPTRLLKTAVKKKRTVNRTGSVLLNKDPAPFVMETKSGKKFVAKRKAKDGYYWHGHGRINTSQKAKLTILYEFKKTVEIKKQWPLVENVGAFVGKHYDDYLTRAINRAVSTMKV